MRRSDGAGSISHSTTTFQSTQISRPSIAPQVLKHGILDDTSIEAASLPNGDRRVIFQQNDGRIRQARYSLKGSKWATDMDTGSQLPDNARNHTPLAVVNNFEDDVDIIDVCEMIPFKQCRLEININQGWLLFYISSGSNNLECLLFPTELTLTPIKCDMFETLDTLNISVSEDSRRLAVQLLPTSFETAFLVIYQDISQHTNVIYFHRSKGRGSIIPSGDPTTTFNVSDPLPWGWHNVTGLIESNIAGFSGLDVLETVIPTDANYERISLVCIVKYHDHQTSSLIGYQYAIRGPGEFNAYDGCYSFHHRNEKLIRDRLPILA